MQEEHFENLNAMLRSNGRAWEYFASLPDYARDEISSTCSSMKTYSSLLAYGENLIRGDR